MIQVSQAEGTAKEGDTYALAVLFWATVQGLCMQNLVTKEPFVVPTTQMISQII
ncbi:MAG: hypothetical protein RR618_07165 [Cellulosilyticaceae bacterium]